MKQYLSTIEEREQLEIELLLETMYRISGFDFREYMRSSIERRIQHRMRLEQIPTISRVIEKVIHEPGYIEKLLSDFSINVTEMFRDPSFFLTFRKQVVPLLRHYPEIRIWHAGCATGEEAYSMAILMEEEGLGDKTKIYATDMNEKVLKKAESGIFSLKKMQTYTRNYLQAGGKQEFSEYYTTDYAAAYFHPSLTRNIIFAQHNLVTDGSFNEFHVIICRNVMIYFNQTLQDSVHDLFYESLSHGGFLGLGNKEALRIDYDRKLYRDFNPIERIYQKC
ncbi:CheR family methyltransferase [Priestia koreensis]|uniref:Chemotaxis protein CheR n=1 Tax=Priestia koreensis TaxID=284581 RepID=A0A0M0LIY7_9BACI|nr:protein-glutamate O-methyltransferase CheR [Priestia koreensis]KOO50678.1 chemotaxis protein CheR [Priestia koreensis]